VIKGEMMISWKNVADRLGGSSSLGIGIATAVLAPRLLPALGRGLRPAVKSAIKGYLVLAGRGRWAVAAARERRRSLPTGEVPAAKTSEG
jgi:hypothetical protein